MKRNAYQVKVSSQGQMTLPSALRSELGVKPGSRVILRAGKGREITVDARLPIEEYFGAFKKTVTGGKDAAEQVRDLRDQEYKKRAEKFGWLA